MAGHAYRACTLPYAGNRPCRGDLVCVSLFSCAAMMSSPVLSNNKCQTSSRTLVNALQDAKLQSALSRWPGRRALTHTASSPCCRRFRSRNRTMAVADDTSTAVQPAWISEMTFVNQSRVGSVAPKNVAASAQMSGGHWALPMQYGLAAMKVRETHRSARKLNRAPPSPSAHGPSLGKVRQPRPKADRSLTAPGSAVWPHGPASASKGTQWPVR